METLVQFKRTFNIDKVQFFPHSKGGKVANVSMISNNGNRVKATIFMAKTIDTTKPLFVAELPDSENFVLCNSKLDLANMQEF